MQRVRTVKRILLVLVFANLIGLAATAQREYFVYLQTDTQQPFYVLLNKKNFSSSAIGHLVLPKLKDSSYTFKIGFAGTSNQLDFEVMVNGADQGFLIKDFGEKGWGLFNLQTMAVQTAGAEKQKRADREAAALAEQAKLQQEAAAALMRQQAMLEKQRADSINAAQLTIAKQAAMLERQRIDSTDAAKSAMATRAATNDTAAARNLGVASQETLAVAVDSMKKVAADTALAAFVVTDSLVMPISGGGPNTAVKMLTRTDTLNVKADTTVMLIAEAQPIRLQIPKIAASPKFLDLEFGVDSTVAEVPTLPTSLAKNDSLKVATAITEVVADPKAPGLTSNNAFTKIVRPASLDTLATATQPKLDLPQPKTELEQPKADEAPVRPKVAVTNCTAIATEADFYILRRKLIAFDTEPEAMIALVKKSFSKKCYTTVHLRHLCMVFLSDTDKLAFLAIAQPFASEPDRFVSLGSLLTDSGAKAGFDALLK